MPGIDAQRLDLGPTTDDRLVAAFVSGTAGFGLAVVTGVMTGSFGYATTMWLAFFVVASYLISRRTGTVVDADGTHHRGLRDRTTLGWAEIDHAGWGEYPARRGDGDGTDVRLYVSSRRGGHVTVVCADGLGLAEPRTWLGRRKLRRFVAAVRALQAHGVPVRAETLSLRSTMWALGLEPDPD